MMKSKVQKICRFFLNLAVNTANVDVRNALRNICLEKGKGNKLLSYIIKLIRKSTIFDQDVRARKRRELGIEDQFVICHVGRLTHQKNPKGVIDILAETVKKRQRRHFCCL